MDLESYRRWWDYTAAYDEMLRLTDTSHAPWWIVDSNDKKAARIHALTAVADHLEANVDMTPPPLDPELERVAKAALGL